MACEPFISGDCPVNEPGQGGGGSGGASTFTGLSDTPADYSGQANKVVSVKADETGLEFTTPAAGGGGGVSSGGFTYNTAVEPDIVLTSSFSAFTPLIPQTPANAFGTIDGVTGVITPPAGHNRMAITFTSSLSSGTYPITVLTYVIVDLSGPTQVKGSTNTIPTANSQYFRDTILSFPITPGSTYQLQAFYFQAGNNPAQVGVLEFSYQTWEE